MDHQCADGSEGLVFEILYNLLLDHEGNERRMLNHHLYQLFFRRNVYAGDRFLLNAFLVTFVQGEGCITDLCFPYTGLLCQALEIEISAHPILDPEEEGEDGPYRFSFTLYSAQVMPCHQALHGILHP